MGVEGVAGWMKGRGGVLLDRTKRKGPIWTSTCMYWMHAASALPTYIPGEQVRVAIRVDTDVKERHVSVERTCFVIKKDARK